jgi:hypothetical protein
MALFFYFKTTIKPPEYPKLSDLFQIRNCPCCIFCVQFYPSGTRHSPLFSYHSISSRENPISSPCFTNSIMAGATDKPQRVRTSFLLVRPVFFFPGNLLSPLCDSRITFPYRLHSPPTLPPAASDSARIIKVVNLFVSKSPCY